MKYLSENIYDDDGFSDGNWTEPQSKSFEEVYGDLGNAQRELSDFTYPDPDEIPEPYISKVPALIQRYIEYLDSRLASGQNFQQAFGETPLPDHAFDDLTAMPHSYTTGVGLAATLHLLASTPGCEWLEYDVTDFPLLESLFKNPPELNDTGQVALPTEPGLGVELPGDIGDKYGLE